MREEGLHVEDEARRNALRILTWLGVTGYCGAWSIPVANYLGGPEDNLGIADLDLGSVEDFTPGSWRLVSRAGKPVLVLALPNGQVRAYSAECPHLGCTVGYHPEKHEVFCSCHGAAFAADSGVALRGPTRNPLQALEVRSDGGRLLIPGNKPKRT